MQGNLIDQVFPPWQVMITMDFLIVAMAVLVTGLFVGFYSKVKRGRMTYGVLLLMGTFWILAFTYFGDLYAMFVLPKQIGMAPAMDAMVRLHTEASWYLNTAAVFCGVLGVYFVVSAFMKQTNDLKAAVAESERQSQHKSAFFASMSHEFRTPLNAIIGFAELIKSKKIDDPKIYDEYANIILHSGNLMLGFVDDLLDLARIEAGELLLNIEKIDIRELFEATTNTMTQLAIEADISLNAQMPDQLPRIEADRRSIEQIMLNLISNAIKYTPEGGSVGVTAEWRDKGLDSECAVLVVSDTGIGMSPVLIENVFDPYVQGDTSGAGRARGTGLGLSLCKRLVAAHNGTIQITSALGDGTTVTVALPTIYAPQKRPERERGAEEHAVCPTKPGASSDEIAA